MSEYDVLVIGAGLAGVTAARECSARGLRVVILEGRDRIGGRVWTIEMDNGEKADIGGTFFSWNQPHYWAEITRYGLAGEVVDAVHDPFEWACTPKGGELVWSTVDEHIEREMPLLESFFEPSYEALPRPYNPLYNEEAIAKIDHMTVQDRIDELGLSKDDSDLLATLMTTFAGAGPDEVSYVSMLRWWATAGHNYVEYYSDLQNSKLKRGQESLVQAILDDSGAELRLSTPVTAVKSDENGASVTLAGGEILTGKAVIVATPSGVWPYLDFDPPLAVDKLEASKESLQLPRGGKTVGVIRGESRVFAITPLPGHPISAIFTTYKRSEGEQLVTVFSGPAMKDPEDQAEVAAAIRDLLPNAELVEMHSSLYDMDDEFTRGAWSVHKAGQLTKFQPHTKLAESEGRVVFATADIASLWPSFLDGAIETGLRAGREVKRILG
ncbi:flavin monoamine oxidase family protein [Rhodococcus koreensis]|uniref:flavin monoamine oxidase family protein n=1 Tax=Rhodococcus koreensis TaxID=99653 RepID=UPI00366FA7C2